MNLTGQPPTGQKAAKLVSKRIRDFAKGQPCTMQLPGCDGGGETTVLCHVRRFGYAGMAQKPHDTWAYHGCARCHAMQEIGNAGDDDLLRAISITQSRLIDAGLIGET